jgi:hypothetical protein
VGFSITDHLQHSSVAREIWEYNETVQQLLADFKKTSDSVKWEVLIDTFTEFQILMILVRLMKACLHKPAVKPIQGKHM